MKNRLVLISSGRRSIFSLLCGTLIAAMLPMAAGAETTGWRLPALASAETTPDAATGWALPAAAKVTADAAGRGVAQPADRPIKELFEGPTLVTTRFAGHIFGRPVLPEDRRAAARDNPYYRVIDLDGAVAALTDIDGFGRAMNADEVSRRAYDQLYARQIGQVFGAVLDDDPTPNLYLAATSAYGLQIVGPDRDNDKLADRLTKGEAEARWMAGQWGFDPLSGPGTIWRVDGLTGQVAIFANLIEGGQENSGPGLGNLAFDAVHDHIFASDLATGLISRLDLRGDVLDAFDHGATGRVAEGLPAVAHDPAARVEISDTAFDALDPATWGFAADERRVWGLTVENGRLFYTVAAGIAPRPEVWSVGLDPLTGAFGGDARWELTLAGELRAHEVSDIGFSADGAMVLAQRGPREPSYDFTELAEVGRSEVVRYVREAPQDDPATPSVWAPAPARYAVGFAEDQTNTTGGLAFGPGYDADGFLDFGQCRSTLWITGEGLRDDTALEAELQPGGQLRVDGVQAQPAVLVRDENSPPWISYHHDFDSLYPDEQQTGYLGDVAVLGCDGGQQTVSFGGDAGDESDQGGDGEPECVGTSCNWWLCARDPAACQPKENACVRNAVTLRCDGQTGTYIADLVQVPLYQASFDSLKLTDPSGRITSLPVTQSLPGSFSVALTGLAPGQIGQISLCSYNSADLAAGAPFDCCNSTVAFQLPALACEKDNP